MEIYCERTKLGHNKSKQHYHRPCWTGQNNKRAINHFLVSSHRSSRIARPSTAPSTAQYGTKRIPQQFNRSQSVVRGHGIYQWFGCLRFPCDIYPIPPNRIQTCFHFSFSTTGQPQPTSCSTLFAGSLLLCIANGGWLSFNSRWLGISVACQPLILIHLVSIAEREI